MVPYKMEQKISCMAEFADSSTEFLLVFLGDGIVKQIKFEDTDDEVPLYSRRSDDGEKSRLFTWANKNGRPFFDGCRNLVTA